MGLINNLYAVMLRPYNILPNKLSPLGAKHDHSKGEA